jgi:hypothetical protein
MVPWLLPVESPAPCCSAVEEKPSSAGSKGRGEKDAGKDAGKDAELVEVKAGGYSKK